MNDGSRPSDGARPSDGSRPKIRLGPRLTDFWHVAQRFWYARCLPALTAAGIPCPGW